MGYEIFTKMTRMPTVPKLTIAKKLGRLQFNASAARILANKGAENILLMWDKEDLVIAVGTITKKDSRAYSLRYAKKGSGAGFSGTAFLHYIGYDLSETRSFECRWNDEQSMFEIPIPKNVLKPGELAGGSSRSLTKAARLESEAKGLARASA